MLNICAISIKCWKQVLWKNSIVKLFLFWFLVNSHRNSWEDIVDVNSSWNLGTFFNLFIWDLGFNGSRCGCVLRSFILFLLMDKIFLIVIIYWVFLGVIHPNSWRLSYFILYFRSVRVPWGMKPISWLRFYGWWLWLTHFSGIVLPFILINYNYNFIYWYPIDSNFII